jgi:hypothetical protein
VKREEALIVSLEQKREQEKINILFFLKGKVLLIFKIVTSKMQLS